MRARALEPAGLRAVFVLAAAGGLETGDDDEEFVLQG
jgi:hypothetical protein